MTPSSRQICRGPVSRRSLLQAGALGLTSLGLGDLLRLRAESAPAGEAESDTSIIFVWLPGGPPHMETYDMKPEAPADYRGEFRPIPTVVPGLEICEHLPLHARLADKFTLVRSVAHEFADHGGGHKRFLTGRIPASPVDFVNDNPMVGSIVAKCRERRNLGIPNYVAEVDAGRHDIDVFSFGSAYLGPETHPFTVIGDPSAPKFEVQNLSLAAQMEGRLDDRVALLSGLDRIRRGLDARGSMQACDEFNGRALALLTSDKARLAFDLSQEPQPLRERYGMHPWGQRALMARRLVEAGVSFVTVVMENCIAPGQTMPKELVYNWDSHAVNCHMYKDALVRLPIYDRTITALVEDLYNRGLDQKVLLVVTGEFGRTPRLAPAVGSQTGVMQPGRDHWPQAMSFLMAGGGMRTGQVVGSTNSKGEHPKDRPLTPNDLWATVYRHLGIDYKNLAFPDHRGRPMPILPFGEPIAELL
ncbi:MAG: DUF1501 domain-containing protein [Planctomycetes bacterium]|nr:DUF1501 domain-containing protein [Planctomycetota bacterium]